MVTDGKETCWCSSGSVYKYQILTLHTWSWCVICQLYLSGEKKDPHMAEELRMRPGAASHLPWRDNLLVPSLRREGARSHQSCGKHPQGPIRKARTESLAHHSVRLCLHRLQKQQGAAQPNTTPQGCSERWEIQGKRQSFVLFCFLKGDGGRAWF